MFMQHTNNILPSQYLWRHDENEAKLALNIMLTLDFRGFFRTHRLAGNHVSLLCSFLFQWQSVWKYQSIHKILQIPVWQKRKKGLDNKNTPWWRPRLQGRLMTWCCGLCLGFPLCLYFDWSKVLSLDKGGVGGMKQLC